MRKRIYEIIEPAKKADLFSRIYDIFLIAVILISLTPLIAKLDYPTTLGIQSFALIIFIGDYGLRWITADFKYKATSHHDKTVAFLRYPFSIFAIINLLVIISLLPIPYAGTSLGGILEAIRVVRICQVFRLTAYSRSIGTIMKVFRRQKHALLTVAIFSVFYILVCALAVYTAEPATFGNFFDAIYWATATLTTIGFGEIYPVSVVGQLITMVSSVFGVLVVALPTGIITAGYVKVVNEQNHKQAVADCAKIHKKRLSDLIGHPES